MIVGSATLPSKCQTHGADLLFEVRKELFEPPLTSSDLSRDVPFADEDFHPRRRMPGVHRPAPEGKTAVCPARSLRVLFVDDNRYEVELLAVLVRSDGHDVHIACDGLTALECVRAYRPEVIFLDVELPGMSGYEVAHRLRTQKETKPIILAALTGFRWKDDRDQLRAAGFDCRLVKPVKMRVLRRLLTSAARGRTQRR